jgi:hypothetical protein
MHIFRKKRSRNCRLIIILKWKNIIFVLYRTYFYVITRDKGKFFMQFFLRFLLLMLIITIEICEITNFRFLGNSVKFVINSINNQIRLMFGCRECMIKKNYYYDYFHYFLSL